MKQAINILIEENKQIEAIRSKHYPNYKKVKPHITLVYPFEYENQQELEHHVKNSIDVNSIDVVFKGLKKSTKEYYLYLLVDKGKKQIEQLHNKLNSGILKNFKNPEMPKFIPHITLGIFKDKKEIDKTMKELKKENLTISIY